MDHETESGDLNRTRDDNDVPVEGAVLRREFIALRAHASVQADLVQDNAERIHYLTKRIADLKGGLESALDRLKWVSDDSESLGFIKSCQPVIRKIEELLKR